VRDVEPIAGILGWAAWIGGVEAAAGRRKLDDQGAGVRGLAGIEAVVMDVENPILPAGAADGLDVRDGHFAKGGHAAAGGGMVPGVKIDEIALHAHEHL